MYGASWKSWALLNGYFTYSGFVDPTFPGLAACPPPGLAADPDEEADWINSSGWRDLALLTFEHIDIPL